MLLLEEYRLRQTAFLSAVVNQAFSGLSKAQQYRIFSIGANPCLRNDVYIYDGLAKSREGWKIIDYQAVQTIRRGEIVDPTQNMKASFSSDG